MFLLRLIMNHATKMYVEVEAEHMVLTETNC
jgi:hypothetical protein